MFTNYKRFFVVQKTNEQFLLRRVVTERFPPLSRYRAADVSGLHTRFGETNHARPAAGPTSAGIVPRVSKKHFGIRSFVRVRVLTGVVYVETGNV